MKLGKLVEFSREIWNQTDMYTNEFPYIEISGVDITTGEVREAVLLPVAEAPSRAKMIVRPNDIIVSTTRPNRGAIAKLGTHQDGFIASTGFAVLRGIKESSISSDYLLIALRSSLSLQQMEQRATGGNYPAITTEDLREIKVVLPERKTQEKIIAGVRAVYEKVGQLRLEAFQAIEDAQKQATDMILA